MSLEARREANLLAGAFHEITHRDSASAQIDEFCRRGYAIIESQRPRLEALCGRDTEKLFNLAVKTKHLNGILELLACYGRQIGTMPEIALFRERALEYMVISYQRIEELKGFEP